MEFFHNLFVNYNREINKFIKEKNIKLFNEEMGNTEEINEKYYILKLYFQLIINEDKSQIEEKVIDLSKYLIYTNFIRNIKLLLKEHPLNSNNKAGTKFWVGTRIPPIILSEISKNKMVYQFIINILSKIFKFSYNIKKVNYILIKNNFFDNIINDMKNLKKEEIIQKNKDFQSLIKNKQIKVNINPKFSNKDKDDKIYHIISFNLAQI